ncbi:MAG: hypothetical protein DI498_04535 [Paracoccus denitrificans]|nr:MAG: hypothetical protein DI498_04535 [Paracoccus denitrificans]PZO85203.1 MAG: hypothetical protein DI633_04535 [Paracoccus denitrificans]
MADPEDLAHVNSGAIDLTGCILTDSRFENTDLSGRDFSGANLDGASFINCNLVGANFENASLVRADFRNSNLESSQFNGSIFEVNFSSANISRTVFQGHLYGCNFSDAKMSGAVFKNSTFADKNVFSNVVIDDNTDFENVSLLRPDSRKPLFKNYIYERGRLHRRISAESTEIEAAVGGGDEAKQKTVDAIDASLTALESVLRDSAEMRASRPGLGHNNPPEEFYLGDELVEKAKRALNAAREDVIADRKNSESLEDAKAVANTIQQKALDWVRARLDDFATEFAKSAGKTLGGKAGLIFSTLLFSETFGNAVAALTKWIGG